jgi:hypothetical protein
VQANDKIPHSEPKAKVITTEQVKQTRGDLLIKDTDLKYLPAAVTDLGHQGQGMVKALDHLAASKFGPVAGANRHVTPLPPR